MSSFFGARCPYPSPAVARPLPPRRAGGAGRALLSNWLLSLACLAAPLGCGQWDGEAAEEGGGGQGAGVESVYGRRDWRGEGPQTLRATHPADAHTQALADALLPEVGAVVGLPPLRPVTAVTMDRAGLRAVLREEMQAQAADERVEHVAAAAEGHELDEKGADEEAYLDQMEDRVLGLYDPRTQLLMLVEGLDEQETCETMRHELTHALQDQHFSLAKLQAKAQATLDGSLALTSVLEGQAMVAMHAQGVAPKVPAPTGPAAGPGLLAALRLGAGGGSRLPESLRALLPAQAWASGATEARPSLEWTDWAERPWPGPGWGRPQVPRDPSPLRFAVDLLGAHEQTAMLVFPYVVGTEFIRTFAQEHTLPDVVRLTLEHVPNSTRHIMHPSAYVAATKPADLPLPALEQMPGHKVVAENRLGEFVSYLMVGAGGEGKAIASGWRGDRTLGLGGFAGRTATVSVSQWRNGVAALRFGRALVAELERRGARHAAGGALIHGTDRVHVYSRGAYLAVVAGVPARDEARVRRALEHDLLRLDRTVPPVL